MITLFSYGGGQDSFAILLKLGLDDAFRKKHSKGKIVVVMSDTGAEHPYTYKHIQTVRLLVSKIPDMEFHFLEAGSRFHPTNWPSLWRGYAKYNSIGSVAFPQTCTDNLKVRPIDNFLKEYIYTMYQTEHRDYRSVIEYGEKYGKIPLILGFAKGEESRAKNSKHDAKWKKSWLERTYPLIEEGIDRQGAQDIIKNSGFPLIPPSNCMTCFYMSEIELLWLYRNERVTFNMWVELEQNKLDNNAGAKDNLGVFGRGTILDKLKIAQEKHGHMSNDELLEYKMSHGHCVKSRY